MYLSCEGGINSKIPKCHQAYFRKLASIKHFVSGLTQPLIRHYHMAELLVPGLSPFFPHGSPEQEPTGQWEVSLNRLVQLFERSQIHKWYTTCFASGARFLVFFFDWKYLKECNQSWLIIWIRVYRPWWNYKQCLFYFFLQFFFFVVNFVIHWNETAIGLHVFPILIPLTSLSTRSP